MSEQARTYVTMAGKSIGKCSSGHWLPLRGECDLCGAGPDQKCQFTSHGRPETLGETFERIIKALNYDGPDTNSLTVGEIRRAL